MAENINEKQNMQPQGTKKPDSMMKLRIRKNRRMKKKM